MEKLLVEKGFYVNVIMWCKLKWFMGLLLCWLF